MEGISPAPGWGVERWSGAESIFGPGAEKGVCTKNTGAVTSLLPTRSGEQCLKIQ